MNMSIDIDKLKQRLRKFEISRGNYEEVKELVRLSTAEGHSNGRWQPTIGKICYQVAYQEKVGGNNYHNCDALDKEITRLIVADLYKYKNKAIENITLRYNKAKEAFDRYEEKDK